MRVLLVVALVGALTGAGLAAAPRAAGAATTDLSVLVTSAAGAPLSGATVTIGATSATTDVYGRALVADVAPGPVTIRHPRFDDRVAEWTGSGDRLRVALGAPALRALHVVGSQPGSAAWYANLDLAGRTALNAVMLDLKDESGYVYAGFSGSPPAPAGLGRWDLGVIANEVRSRGLELIVRIVAYQDPRFAEVAPYTAVHDAATGGPFRRRGQVFLDPTDPVAQRYVRELAEAACAAGVDEVQLDYIRFPDGITPSLRFDDVDAGVESQRVAAITDFVGSLRATLPTECRLAADIFGFVTSISGDGGIGQSLEAMAGVADVVSPMVYPDHWSRGWFGYDSPEHHPAGVVRRSMTNARDRVGSLTTLRPWLQDFGWYGPAEVRAQIDAADALGMGWMIWNARSEYHTSALPTDAEVHTPAVPPAPVEETLPTSGFWDVPDGGTFTADVAWLGAEGITRGCNPPWRDEYCPRRVLTRGEVAAFLTRALGLPPSDVDRFSDDDGTTHEADIDALAAAGITRGCGPDRYCPHAPVTRAQMASFLARALGLPFVAGDTFVDDDHSSHERDIERIAAVGITRGCSPVRYCPDDGVTREQLAAFLHRALAA